MDVQFFLYRENLITDSFSGPVLLVRMTFESRP